MTNDMIKKVKDFLRSLATNWDCDSGANDTHPSYCRCCVAQSLLDELSQTTSTQFIDGIKQIHYIDFTDLESRYYANQFFDKNERQKLRRIIDDIGRLFISFSLNPHGNQSILVTTDILDRESKQMVGMPVVGFPSLYQYLVDSGLAGKDVLIVYEISYSQNNNL